MAIILRNGLMVDFDPEKMRAAEMAVVTDKRQLYIAFAPGDAVRVATQEDIDAINKRIDEAVLDNVISLFDGTKNTYNNVMQQWFETHGADATTPQEITELVDLWYSVSRDNWIGGVQFYQPTVSAVSTGTKIGDNANMVCVPSTKSAANRDDYAGHPLFACVDCNFIVDPDTLEPLITAIDGIHDTFERTNPEKYVGVLQMAGYRYSIEDAETYTVGYAARRNVQADEVAPLAEAVRLDGTVRTWVVHAKYMSHQYNNGLASYAGVIPTGLQSHNSVHTHSRVNGAQYSGTSVSDDAFMKLMFFIKYASLTADGILQGCVECNYQKFAAVAETGVKRVLLTPTDATDFESGMGVLIGTYNSTDKLDRTKAAVYNITGIAGAIITSITDVTIDGTVYKALNVDTASTFDVVANGEEEDGTTIISTFHWPNGTSDSVQGNDGSIGDPTTGKYPAKLQGIEYMNGGYETIADAILQYTSEDDGVYAEAMIVDRSANQTSSVTDNYVGTGVKIKVPSSAGWRYIEKMQFANGACVVSAIGGGSTTYTRDAIYLASSAGVREWMARGSLAAGAGHAGLSAAGANSPLSSAVWYYLARLSPNGNRGEWAA